MSAIDGDAAALSSMALLRWFEDLADRGIFTTDEQLVVRSWNPWLEAQTGIASADAVGQRLLALFPSLNERGLDHYYHDALEGEVRVLSERLHKFLIPIARNTATVGVSEMAQSARIAPLIAGGAVVGTITVIEDVTERVISERELRSQIAESERARASAEDASRLKDEFLATLSHEIRTPLNAVLGWSQILRTEHGMKSREHALDVIERNARMQLKLVEDLLDMARVISGKLRLDAEPVDMRDVASGAIEVVQPAAAARRIAIHADLAPDLPLVNGDADRLQQAVWNLLSNAVKFTGPGGRIDVRLSRTDTGVELSVRDSGEGIERDFLPFIFDRFRQADASASRRHGGLGLGLALVRQIVELHGGTVSANSGGKGLGTTITVRIPETDLAVHTPRRAGETGSSLRLNGIVVLLVDDNEDGRDMLAAALRGYGAAVESVGTADEALHRLADRQFMPHILVSDIGMPGVDGYEFIRRVRSSAVAERRALPAIAVTAYANPEDRIRALAAGYQLHVAKPIDAAGVAAAIASLITTREPARTAEPRPRQ
jgi:PAS domain S-box-containing protein